MSIRVIALLLTIVFSMAIVLPGAQLATGEAPTLPGIVYNPWKTPSSNVSMNKPVVAFPGDTIYIQLKDAYSGVSVSGGYIWTVKLVGSSLKLFNYTVTAVNNGGVVSVKLPQDVEGGVYDIVLTGSQSLYLPRSLWVIKTLGDVLRIVHFSDQHYGAGTPNIIIGDENKFAGYLVTGLLNPDIVIDTGDIADTASETQYQQAVSFEYALLYSFPIFGNPGNHDFPNDQYINYFGDTQWYRVIGGRILVVAVNTREEGPLDWDQIVFLENTLKQYSNIPIKILLMHHPMFYYQGELVTSSSDTQTLRPYVPGGPWTPLSSYWSGNMTSFFYTLRLIEDYNVTYVLAGHVHRDLFVKYTSTRTNTTTYFLTVTTLGMGSAIYDGLDYYALNTKDGSLSFPIVPSTFIGFSNITGALAQNYKPNHAMNSIPIGIYPAVNDYGQANMSYIPAVLYQTPHAYIVNAFNNLTYLNLSGVVVWALPWRGDFIFNTIRTIGNAHVEVVDKLLVGDRLFVALNISLPSRSGVEFSLANTPDNTPPTVSIKLTVPSVPTLGRQLTVYLDLMDSEWGPKDINITYTYDGKTIPIQPTLSSPGTLAYPFSTFTYLLTLPSPSGSQPASAYLNVTGWDNAGHTVSTVFKITFYPAGQTPTATPIETLTTTTTTTYQTTTTTTTSSTTITTTTTTATTTSTTTSTTTQPTTTTQQGSSALWLIAIVVILVVVVLAVVLMAKRR
ncbi:MAG: metallophosphoesterase [Thermogladius sp.]|nr:metallophosphoesterase [Thermogladius sp.]